MSWQSLGRIGLSLVRQVGAILAHEGGHYVAAKAYGLNPRVSLTPTGAHTVYDAGATEEQDTVISLAGPVSQALFVLLTARGRITPTTCAVAAAVLARNLAPVESSDGERLWGARTKTASLRGAAYWGTSAAALAIGAAERDGRPLLDQFLLYDLYVGRARKWVESGALNARLRNQEFEL